MTSKFQHVKLINLFRPGTVDRATSSDVNKFPVADQLMHRSTGPMICSTQFSRCGQWVGRIRYPYRSSRQAQPLTKTVCLNTQGLKLKLAVNSTCAQAPLTNPDSKGKEVDHHHVVRVTFL